MKRGLSTILLTAAALGACAALPQAPAPAKAVFVTRHMQKAEGPDPSLSAEGAANAERLAEALADKGIAAIYATPTRRAIETAEPLSRRTGVAITPYDPSRPGALVAPVAAAAGSVLVVGHSNTVHDLVARFGGRTPPAPLTEQDYGTVYVIDAEGGVGAIPLR